MQPRGNEQSAPDQTNRDRTFKKPLKMGAQPTAVPATTLPVIIAMNPIGSNTQHILSGLANAGSSSQSASQVHVAREETSDNSVVLDNEVQEPLMHHEQVVAQYRRQASVRVLPSQVTYYVPVFPSFLDPFPIFFKAVKANVPNQNTPEFIALIGKVLNSYEKISRAVDVVEKNLNVTVPILLLLAGLIEQIRILVALHKDVPLNSYDPTNKAIRYTCLAIINFSALVYAVGNFGLIRLKKKQDDLHQTLSEFGVEVLGRRAHSHADPMLGHILVPYPTTFGWDFVFEPLPQTPGVNASQAQINAFETSQEDLEFWLDEAERQSGFDSTKWKCISAFFNMLAPIMYDILGNIQSEKNTEDGKDNSSNNGVNTGFRIAKTSIAHLLILVGYLANRRHDLAEDVNQVAKTGLAEIRRARI